LTGRHRKSSGDTVTLRFVLNKADQIEGIELLPE
jgi:hypothetical protein